MRIRCLARLPKRRSMRYERVSCSWNKRLKPDDISELHPHCATRRNADQGYFRAARVIKAEVRLQDREFALALPTPWPAADLVGALLSPHIPQRHEALFGLV